MQAHKFTNPSHGNRVHAVAGATLVIQERYPVPLLLYT